MKTSKQRIALLIAGLFLVTITGFAQEEESSYQMAEIMYMLPKIGHEADFVKGVKNFKEKMKIYTNN